ncbi:hypothetical protein GCM10010981_11520 [Dyella nitratireducens]|uniref:Uncharacterized protein n=1 Tax=Dyella nitratireducens TaxID=1849580 RepID=A0ABQ1FQ14_9GAMM|nr:hypothetical protein GCM10010981_11520 [Dyella nitratireducens]
MCRVAQGRLAVCSSHAVQPAGLLDVTPSFKFDMLGPHCMRISRCSGVSTDSQSAFNAGTP